MSNVAKNTNLYADRIEDMAHLCMEDEMKELLSQWANLQLTDIHHSAWIEHPDDTALAQSRFAELVLQRRFLCRVADVVSDHPRMAKWEIEHTTETREIPEFVPLYDDRGRWSSKVRTSKATGAQIASAAKGCANDPTMRELAPKYQWLDEAFQRQGGKPTDLVGKILQFT